MKTSCVRTVLGALAIVALLTGAAQADQVMLNPGMELGVAPAATSWAAIDWKGSAGMAVVDAAIAHSGDKCWKADGKGSQPGIWQVAKFTPASGTVTAEAWFNVPTLQAPVNAELRCWYKKDAGTGYVDNPVILAGTITSAGWTKISGSFTTSPAIAAASDSFEIRVVAYTGGTEFYIDDVAVNAPVAVPEPASMASLLTGGLGMLGFAIRRRK